MEVIAGLSSILQVIDSVTRVAKRLNEVRETYNNVALNTTLVASQLSTIRAALEALYDWRASDRDLTGPSKQLDKDLGMSLGCCAILISVIDGKLDDSGHLPGLKQKIKYLWLEDILKEYISNLEGQVRALQLLLTIFQCRTETEKRQKLGNEESRTIIEQVRAETASLAFDNGDFQDAASVLSLDPSVTLDIDSILMKSPAYKRVYGDARLRLPPVVSASPIENSDQAPHPAPTPRQDQTLQPPPLPSRPTRKPMPQSRGRINVWDYYPGEREEDRNVDEMIMADSVGVFELSGEMKGSSAISQRSVKSKEERGVILQHEETATKGSSTRTSSPYSCVSCRNIGVTDYVSENDELEAEIHDLDHSSPQPESGSADVQRRDATDESLIKIGILDETQKNPASVDADTLNEIRLQPPEDVSPIVPMSTTIEQHAINEDLTTCSPSLVNDLHQSKFEGPEQVGTSPSIAGLGLQCVKTSDTSDAHLQETKEPCSSMQPRGLIEPPKPSASLSPPAVVFSPSAESRNPETEQSTLSSDRPSSAHDATSTISSSEPPEDSTIVSLQQSTTNTTATSISTLARGFDRDQGLSDLRSLQDELATAKARGDSRAVQASLQRSIEVIRRKYLIEPPAEDNNASNESPSPRLRNARSNIIRFPLSPGSTKGVALGHSAAFGDTLSLQKMLKEKINVDFRSDNYKTPLMRAAMNGHIECMKLLKQFGADEVAVDAKGRTALHLAVASNRLAAVKWLLETYPPPKIDPLRHRPSILFRATDKVKALRSQKNLRETSDAEGSKPLHIAAERDEGGMIQTLVAAGVDVESKDNWGRTPFHRAITSKRRDSFDTLLRSGAQIAMVDARSLSSLHLAAEAGQVDMIETLLANGAKRWDFDAGGNRPIHSAVWGGHVFAIEALVTEKTDLEKRTKSGETLLHLACLKKDLEAATYLLTKLVDVNPWAAPSSGMLQMLSHTKIKGSSMTPLHYACCLRDFEMAVLLLSHEAWVNAPTPEGATALMMAVENEDTNLANLLLEGGAKVNAKMPGSAITALHLAARRGDLETVQQLCRQGADIRARTSDSSYRRSPRDECLKCTDKEKSRAVEIYMQTVLTNSRRNTLRANASNLQASRTSGAQISRSQQGYLEDQGNVAQQAQAQNPQYYHPDFDVPDDVLPAYEPGPSAPARLANQAPVYREYA